MERISHIIYLSSEEIPERKEGEENSVFESRMENFRKRDKRIATNLFGKKNFSFKMEFTLGNGIIGRKFWVPMPQLKDGEETGKVAYEKDRGGSWGVL